jgi:hypothetical protein
VISTRSAPGFAVEGSGTGVEGCVAAATFIVGEAAATWVGVDALVPSGLG